MAEFFQKQQDEHVYHLCQQLAGAVEAILNPNSSRDKRIEATRVSASFVIVSCDFATACKRCANMHVYSQTS